MTTAIIKDINALNNFEKNKETDLGIRITRHLKLLKRTSTLSHVLAVWVQIVGGDVPAFLSATPELDQGVNLQIENISQVSKPTRIYVKTLALLHLLKEKRFEAVDRMII